MRKAPLLFLVVMLFALTSCKYLRTYDLTFFVFDDYGKYFLEGATVKLIDKDGTVLSEQETDYAGSVRFKDLSFGTYKIYVEAEGYFDNDTVIKVEEPDQTASLTIKPLSQPAGGIINAKVLSYTSSSATFELTFFVTNYEGKPISYLSSDEVHIEDAYFPGGYYFDFTKQSFDEDYYYGDGYSVAVTIDQSGSISSTDPTDSRIIGAKIFFATLGNNYAHLFAFAQDGMLPYDITYWGDYTSDGLSFFNILDDLKNMEGGGTPLYRAAYIATNDVYNYGPYGYKYVLLFTDGEDTEGGYTLDDVVNNAKSKGVVIHTVGLGDGTNLKVLAQIAYGTGGFLIKSLNQYQLVSVFRALSILMQQGGTVYKGIWKVNVDGDVFPGWFETSIEFDYGSYTYYIPFHVDVPSAKLAKSGVSQFESKTVQD